MQTTALVMDLLAAVPNPGQGQRPPGGEDVEKIISWVAWVALGVCVMGVIISGAAMAVAHQRHGGGEHASRLAWVLGGCVIVGSASGLVGALA